MTLTLEQIQHIANLARLEITHEESISYHAQLSAILAYFQRLEEIDTENVPPDARGLDIQSVLRSDQPVPGLGLADVLRNAAHTEGSQFQVPPIFD